MTEIGQILAFVSHFCRRKIQNAYFSDRLLAPQGVKARSAREGSVDTASLAHPVLRETISGHAGMGC